MKLIIHQNKVQIPLTQYKQKHVKETFHQKMNNSNVALLLDQALPSMLNQQFLNEN